MLGILLYFFVQAIEDDPKYWEVISSALAVGWLEIVVSRLQNCLMVF